jgi:ABC-type multidrug transport system ATPase subunit
MNLIELNNVSKIFFSKKVITNVNLQIRAGEFVVLKGDNGSGKTTLLNLILGILQPSEGEVKLFGCSPQSPESKLKLGVVLQKVAVPPNLKVKELVNLLRSYYPNSPSTEEILTRVNLHAKSDYLAAKLSGGEEQRLFFAIALSGNPELLILDEPTRNLDPEGLREFWGQIQACREQKITILMVTNNNSDWQFLDNLATRTITIAKGTIAEDNLLSNSAEKTSFENNQVSLNLGYFAKIWLEQIKFEFKQYFANYEIIIGIILFSLIALLLPHIQNDKIDIDKALLVILAFLFIVIFSLVSFGKIVAYDRVEGWLKLLRFTPLPPYIYLGSKVIVFLVLLIIFLLTMFSLGAWKLGIQQTSIEWIILICSFIFGCIPILILGLALGYILKPKAIDIIAMLLLPIALATIGLPLPVSTPTSSEGLRDL